MYAWKQDEYLVDWTLIDRVVVAQMLILSTILTIDFLTSDIRLRYSFSKWGWIGVTIKGDKLQKTLACASRPHGSMSFSFFSSFWTAANFFIFTDLSTRFRFISFSLLESAFLSTSLFLLDFLVFSRKVWIVTYILQKKTPLIGGNSSAVNIKGRNESPSRKSILINRHHQAQDEHERMQ